MKRLSVVAALFFGFLAGPAWGLNLTPLRILVDNPDGPAQERYYFQGEGRRLAFRIDDKMTVYGSHDLAIFRFNDIGSATTRLQRSSADIKIPFDEKGTERYQTIARTVLPPDAKNIALIAQTPDAISINGWKSVQFVYTYDLFGFSYRRAITFINFSETEQFIFDVSARKDDYAKIYARSYRVLNSIFDLPLSSDPGPS